MEIKGKYKRIPILLKELSYFTVGISLHKLCISKHPYLETHLKRKYQFMPDCVMNKVNIGFKMEFFKNS